MSKDAIINLITNYTYTEELAKDKLHKNAWNYNVGSIMTWMVDSGNYISFLAFISIVGEEVFSKFVFLRCNVNTTVFEAAVSGNKIEMIRYMASLDNVKRVYQSSSYWMYRLCWWCLYYLKNNNNTDDNINTTLAIQNIYLISCTVMLPPLILLFDHLITI